MVAVAMVTLLTGLILMGLNTVNLELLKSRGEVEFQIYWKQGAPSDTVSADWDAIAAMEHVAEFTSFTPEDALTELASSLGESGDFFLAGRGKPPAPLRAGPLHRAARGPGRRVGRPAADDPQVPARRGQGQLHPRSRPIWPRDG